MKHRATWVLAASILVGCPVGEVELTEPGSPEPTTPTVTTPSAPEPVGCLEVSPPSLNLGEHAPGTVVADPLVLVSACDGPLIIDELDLSGDIDVITLGTNVQLPFTLTPGRSLVLEVQADVDGYGAFAAPLTVVSNDVPSVTVVGIDVAGVCESLAVDVDGDGDTVPDACDVCDGGDDAADLDVDGTPDACDRCPGFSDAQDADLDTIPDACDICEAGDDLLDTDGDTVPDACDACVLGDDLVDADGDTVPNACDTCVFGDDLLDADGDSVADACDVCALGDDAIDPDGDGIPSACDQCPVGPDSEDADADGVADVCDACANFDDAIDTDLDLVPDACDVCEGFDDRLDDDGDLVPDSCDVCAFGDDALDADGDSVPDACDVCPGANDLDDPDLDGLPTACDPCVLGPNDADADTDGVADACDRCEGFDDLLDTDADSVPDDCDQCPFEDDLPDEDGDTVPDCLDRCPGADDRIDVDGDLIPDACDACLVGSTADSDGDGVPDGCDACPGADDGLDADADGVPDDCDACVGFDDTLDADVDTVPDACDVCPGRDDGLDADLDGVADGCDRCLGGDDALDADSDGIPDACDRCVGFDDTIDLDRDGFPDRPDCDSCIGAATSYTYVSATSTKVDVLIVVDDSAGMEDDQAQFATIFPTFEAELAQAGVDWQIAVITTSSSTFRGPIITPGANAAAAFATQVQPGGFGLGLEQGIQRAYDATQPGGDAAPGSAFLRADANLAILFFSDEPDGSTVSATEALDYWQSIRMDDPERVIVHGFLWGPLNGYDALVTTTGGIQVDMSMTGYPTGPELASMGLASVASAVATLPSAAVPSTLAVRVDGTPIRSWRYVAEQPQIRFVGALPTLGSSVTIDYVEDCGGVALACSDGVDNDGDGRVDFPDEPGCRSEFDTNEADPFTLPTCADGLDNDGDGFVDHPDDGECNAASHPFEACGFVEEGAFGYRVCEDATSSTVCPDLSASATPLPLGDEGAVQVPLGFGFDFYGGTHQSVFVGANGTLAFGIPLSPPTNACLGDATMDDTIAVWWDDLNPALGSVWATTSGAAPNRTFEVQWVVPHFSGGADLDVRAVLHEGSNDIDLCYVQATSLSVLSDGQSATSGIRGVGSALETSCFESTLTSGTTFRFEHP